MIALLSENSDFHDVEFPILSWLGKPYYGDYDLFVERASQNQIIVYNAAMNFINNNFEFGECYNCLKLERKSPTNDRGEMLPLNGASFCKIARKNVRALVSLNSGLAISTCSWSQLSLFKMSSYISFEPVRNNRNYVCGFRWDWNDVKSLYEIGLSVASSFPQDNVIPDGTIGTKQLELKPVSTFYVCIV